MRNRTLLSAVSVLALVLSAGTARAEEEGTYKALLAAKAPNVVAVKLVMSVKIMSGGAVVQGPSEQSSTATGVIVDASGLIMLPVGALGTNRTMRRQGMEFTINATPSNIRVVFPGDTKEYEAIIGAKDTKLGLGFVLIRELGGKTLTPIDSAAKAEPATGKSLYSVARLGQGFDYAPMVQRVRVAGKVTKPRDMWILQGANGSVGKPLYDAAGAMAGIVVNQEGVGEGATARPFLLPLAVALPTIKSGLKKSKAELERILEEEEEAAAEAAEAKKDEDAEKKADGDEKKDADGEKKDDGGKDDGK